MLKVSILFSILISLLYPFNFEGFKSGDTIEDVVMVAKKRDIPITYHSSLFTKIFHQKHFSFKHIKDYKNYSILYYPNTFFGLKSKVYLYFTPKDKKLYRVTLKANSTNLTDNAVKDIIYKKIKDDISKEYGNPIKAKGAIKYKLLSFKRLYGSKTTWKAQDNLIIIFAKELFSLKLTYIDPTLIKYDDINISE